MSQLALWLLFTNCSQRNTHNGTSLLGLNPSKPVQVVEKSEWFF